LNFYAYANGNPVSYLDPFGMGAAGENSLSSWIDNAVSSAVDYFQGMNKAGMSFLGQAINPFGTLEEVGGLSGALGTASVDPYGYISSQANNVINSLQTANGIGELFGNFEIMLMMGEFGGDVPAPNAADAGADVLRVRHYTSYEGLQGIQDSGEIWASRGDPIGVHVEVGPNFGPAATGATDTGAAAQGTRGVYVEFDAPGAMVPTPWVGPRTTAVIPTTSPLPISSLNPTFVKPPWWKIW
jgi:hypothetical protein